MKLCTISSYTRAFTKTTFSGDKGDERASQPPPSVRALIKGTS